MAEYTLIKIDQLPIGTITESSPIMFGIGDEIYTCLASELIDLLPTESPNVRPRLVDLNITVLEANLGTFLASQNLTIASGEIVFIRFGVIRSNGFIGRDTYAVPLSDGIYEPLGTTISFSQLILINQENFNVNGDGNTVTYSFANIEEINASDPPIDFTDEDLVYIVILNNFPYLFIGENGLYGDGELTMVEGDLQALISPTGVETLSGILVDNLDPANPIVNGLIVQQTGNSAINQIKEIEIEGAEVTNEGGNKIKVTITGGSTPTLQEVTDEGNETTNPIRFNTAGSTVEIGCSDVSGQFYFVNEETSNFKQQFSLQEHTDDRNAVFPDKDGTIALTSDIPTNTSDLINDGQNGTSPYVTADQLPSNLNLYATNVSSDIATYFKLVTSIDDPDYNDTAVDIPTGAITTTGQFIAALATTANVLVGNPGIINILTIGNVRRTSGTGTAEFYYEIYHRNSGGTETLIATSSKTPPVSTNVYTEFLAAALLNNGTFLATDRIVVKYYADRIAGGSNPNYDFQFGGTSPVRTNFPIPATNIPLDATPTDGSTNGVQSNGVFDALALKVPNAIRVGYTSLTGVTGANVLASILIPANWLNDGESFKVEITNFKSVTAGSVNFAMYHDTVLNGVSNTISNGQQLTSLFRVGGVFYRLMTIDGTTLYNSVSSNAVQQVPAASTAAANTTTFDRTVNNYITVTSNPSAISEVTGFYYLSVTKI